MGSGSAMSAGDPSEPRVPVCFRVSPHHGAHRANLCGDFNDWSADAHPMHRCADGSFEITVELAPHRSYRYRFLLDDARWVADESADDYAPNPFGGHDSVRAVPG